MWGAPRVQVEHTDGLKNLVVVVVKWIKPLQLDWQSVHNVEGRDEALQELLTRHETVFKEELGTLKGFTAKIQVASEAKPCFFKARSVPIAIKKKIEQELERLMEEKIIQPVKFSEWAAPIFPKLKPDASVRICIDYKFTVNKVSPVEHYPKPKMEDMMTGLPGEKIHQARYESCILTDCVR